MATRPGLFDLAGRVEHAALERAVDLIHDGLYPGWSIVYDEIGVELYRGQGQAQRGWAGLSGIVEGAGPSATPGPQRVWVVVLEEGATGQREVFKFLLDGGSEDQPEWIRIRPDASTPVPQLPEG